MSRNKPTEAFEKYVDPIFIIQNGLMFVAPKKFCERFDTYEYSLETYHDEQCLWAGMCVELAEKIKINLDFKNTYNLYLKKVNEIASNHSLDYFEVKNRTNKLDRTLFAHAKLEFCFEKFLKEFTLNNDISVLACLMAIYEKTISMKNSKFPNLKMEKVYLTNWYRYVRFAYLEEDAIDIKDFSKLSLQDLCENLFDLIVESQYRLKNSVKETYLSSEGDNIELDIFVLEKDNDLELFKQEIEQKVFDWMVEQIHKRENTF